MKVSISSVGKTGFRFTNMVFVAALIGAGFASAQTYQHGDSTTIIEQSGGSTESESQITRYEDGQRIITQDGNSTDITIQRTDGSLASDDSDDFKQRMRERMRIDFPD